MRRIIVSREEWPQIIEAIQEAMMSHPDFLRFTWEDSEFSELLQPDPWDTDSRLRHGEPDVLWVCAAFFTRPDGRIEIKAAYFDRYKGVPFFGSPRCREWWDRDTFHVTIHGPNAGPGECARCRRNRRQ